MTEYPFYSNEYQNDAQETHDWQALFNSGLNNTSTNTSDTARILDPAVLVASPSLSTNTPWPSSSIQENWVASKQVNSQRNENKDRRTRNSRSVQSQFPYPVLTPEDWWKFCHSFQPPPEHQLRQLLQESKDEARMLEIYLTVDDRVGKSNPVEVVLHALTPFGPVEVIRTCTDKTLPKWQRRHGRTILVQMYSSKDAMEAYACGTIEAGYCVLSVVVPPLPATLKVSRGNVCMFAYEAHRLSDSAVLSLLRRVVPTAAFSPTDEKRSRVERALIFETVDDARRCVAALQKPLLDTFNVLLYAFTRSDGDEPSISKKLDSTPTKASRPDNYASQTPLYNISTKPQQFSGQPAQYQTGVQLASFDNAQIQPQQLSQLQTGGTITYFPQYSQPQQIFSTTMIPNATPNVVEHTIYTPDTYQVDNPLAIQYQQFQAQIQQQIQQFQQPQNWTNMANVGQSQNQQYTTITIPNIGTVMGSPANTQGQINTMNFGNMANPQTLHLTNSNLLSLSRSAPSNVQPNPNSSIPLWLSKLYQNPAQTIPEQPIVDNLPTQAQHRVAPQYSFKPQNANQQLQHLQQQHNQQQQQHQQQPKRGGGRRNNNQNRY